MQLLRKSTDYVSGLKQLRIDTDATLELVYPNGQKLQYGQHVVITVQRPNKVRADRVGEVINQTFYYDGKSLTLSLPDDHYYATEAAPPTIDGMLNFARDELSVIAPGSDLITRTHSNAFRRPDQALSSGNPWSQCICDHIAFHRARSTVGLDRGRGETLRGSSSPPADYRLCRFSVVLSGGEAAPNSTTRHSRSCHGLAEDPFIHADATVKNERHLRARLLPCSEA
jgi:hypothetical protein